MPQQKITHTMPSVVGSALPAVGRETPCEAGLKVRASRSRAQSNKNFTEHQPAFELNTATAPRKWSVKPPPFKSNLLCNEYTYKLFVNDLEEPYTTPATSF